MVLTILVLIHHYLSSQNKGPGDAGVSSVSSNSEEKHSAKNFERRQGLDVKAKTVTNSGERSYPLAKSKSQSNFSIDFAIVAVCRFSTPLLAVPIQKPRGLVDMSLEDRFRAAVRVIHSLPKDGPYQPSNDVKLKFYGLYKQATEGKVKTGKPMFWDVVGSAKYTAWHKLGDMSKEEAMNKYVECLKEIVETMAFNGDVEDFLDSIGPFYEFVTLQGSEMSRIKEKIEEVASSCGSSLANSLSGSANNSKQNSPVKEISNQVEGEEEDEEASTSETAEISVENTTATYETKAGKNYSNLNGNAFKTPSSHQQRHVTYEDATTTIPPPAPTHSYSQQNGFLKNMPPLNHDDDEVLLVSASPSPHIPSCKEDLERDIDYEVGDSSVSHAKVKVTSSIETVASVATSGTESEKYYSGDSEPEIEEKFTTSLYKGISNNPEIYPSTSAAALQQQMHENNEYHPLSKKQVSSPSNQMKKVKSPRISPSSVANRPDADLAVQQTVERLNRDVDHILARLRILEAAYAANAESIRSHPGNNSSSNSKKKSRIFGELSPQSIAFIVMWPFVVQFLVKLIRWWWRRRNALRSLRSINN